MLAVNLWTRNVDINIRKRGEERKNNNQDLLSNYQTNGQREVKTNRTVDGTFRSRKNEESQNRSRNTCPATPSRATSHTRVA